MLTLITPLLIAWFITHFTPAQSLIDWGYEYLPEKLHFTREVFGCFKCVSLWTALLMTFNPVLAIAFSAAAYTYDRLVSSLPIRI